MFCGVNKLDPTGSREPLADVGRKIVSGTTGSAKRVLCGLLLGAAFLCLGAPASLGAGDAERGKDLYKRYCRGCHGVDGRGGAHTFMPHVDRLTEKGYIDLLPDEYLYQVIIEGGAFVGKSSYMPAWKTQLSDQDVQDLIAHIRQFRLH